MAFGNRCQRADSILEELSDHEKKLPVALNHKCHVVGYPHRRSFLYGVGDGIMKLLAGE